MSLSLPKVCNMGSSQIGLEGIIGVTLLNPDGTIHTARTTVGIYEIDNNSGCYGANIEFPDGWKGSLLWDTGESDPVYAVEEYNIRATLGNETVSLSSATETQIDNIETDTNEIQGKLPTNYIMGSSVVTDKDDEIDTIMAKTDNLPTDPADQSLIESAISTSEETLRGAASINVTLESLSTQLDGVQTDLDNPNQYKANVSGIPTNPLLTTDARIDTIAGDVAGLDGSAMVGTNGVPTNPLLTNDARLDNLDTTIGSRSSHADPTSAIIGTPGKTNQEVFDNEKGTDGAYTGTPPTVGEIRTEMEGVGTKLTGVKDQTDKMTFSGDNIQSRVADKGILNNPPSENIDDYKANVTNLDVTVSSRSSHADPTSAIEATISSSESNIRGVDNDTLKVLSTQLDSIAAKTGNLPSGIPKGVAFSDFAFLMVDGIDHVTPKIGLTIEAYISKDGGAFGNCTNNVVEIGNGIYKINLTAPEMTAKVITLRFTATGADTRHVTLVTSI